MIKVNYCPYCGKLPRLYPAQHKNGWESVDCINDDCDIQPTTGYMEYYEAIKTWNSFKKDH